MSDIELTESKTLTPEGCRLRQKRLIAVLEQAGADHAILTRSEHVQYLTGFRPHHLMLAAIVLDTNGHCLLVAPNVIPDGVSADAVVTYEAQWHSTLRQDQHLEIARVLSEALMQCGGRGKCVAVESSRFGPHLQLAERIGKSKTVVDIEKQLWHMRRRKDPDELQMIRRAVDCTHAMYQRAREIIEPGVSELEVFSQLQTAAVEIACEPLTGTGNDYRCGSSGGPPRSRLIESGELYILDLGPAYRGYYADNCRTFAVNQRPTDAQQSAWEQIVAVLEMVSRMVCPGVRCRDVFQEAQSMLDEYWPGAFSHHLGHGIGLFPHEGPHLNPNTGWNDTFEEGDVFTAEPGLYTPELRAGIRLEENYLVTADGVEQLTRFPLEL